MSLLYAGITVLTFLVMSRIIAETGLFYMQPYFSGAAIMWGIFGSKALGPKTILILYLLTTVILGDPREVIMPYIVNSFKLIDLQKVKLGRTAIFCIVAVLLGLFLAVPITLYFQYDRGYNQKDKWAANEPPKWAYSATVFAKQRLEAQGLLEESNKISGWKRFTKMVPNTSCIIALGAGLFLVFLFFVLRLRSPKWPFHPIMFLIWATYPAHLLFFSFLLGWLIKSFAMKYGGVKFYQKLKPLMVGLIAGELLGAFAPSIIAWIYFFITNELPKSFHVFPT